MSKKKKRSANRKKGTPGGAAKSATGAKADRGTHFDLSLYQAYKASTEYVKQWGVVTWQSVLGGSSSSSSSQPKKKKQPKGQPLSLATIVRQLEQLAEAQVPIPKSIFSHLRRAIRFRRRVGRFYDHLDFLQTDADHSGHR